MDVGYNFSQRSYNLIGLTVSRSTVFLLWVACSMKYLYEVNSLSERTKGHNISGVCGFWNPYIIFLSELSPHHVWDDWVALCLAPFISLTSFDSRPAPQLPVFLATQVLSVQLAHSVAITTVTCILTAPNRFRMGYTAPQECSPMWCHQSPWSWDWRAFQWLSTKDRKCPSVQLFQKSHTPSRVSTQKPSAPSIYTLIYVTIAINIHIYA